MTAFEPGREALRWLRENVRLNDLDAQVDVQASAVGASIGRSRLASTKPGNLGATSFEAAADGDVPLVRLDDHDFDRVDALKIDVEGNELDAREGPPAFCGCTGP